MPTIETFHRRTYRLRGDVYQLDVVDTSGNDPYPAAKRLMLATGVRPMPLFYQKRISIADMLMLVCSPDIGASVDVMLELRDEIMQVRGERDFNKAPVVMGTQSVFDNETTREFVQSSTKSTFGQNTVRCVRRRSQREFKALEHEFMKRQLLPMMA